uniref:Uncharacterized protein At5g41620 n=1 Tax=Anthurium amnicola TaxID=1678845 RepID=A0A1D1XHP8_9ARAE
MPRVNRGLEGVAGGGGCKIRKRGCSSTSSSSMVMHKYRLKRAILVGRRGGTSTPVPAWRSPSSTAGMSNCSYFPLSNTSGKRKQAPVSARKLATALWELNGIPGPQMTGNLKEERRLRRGMRWGDRTPKSGQSGSLPPHLSDPSYSPVSETTDRSGSGGHRRRMRVISQKPRLHERSHRALDSVTDGNLMEIEAHSRGFTPTSSTIGVRSHLKDLSNGLTACKELLKILNRIWGLEEQHSSSASLVSALHAELERACVQVDRLVGEQRSEQTQIKHLKKRFAEEKSAWKRKERERIKSAAEFILEELKLEKKLRRRSEKLNQKLGVELTETKTAVANFMKELESERRSREIIEQVCDELVRGVGEDKAQVEEMKRESAKALEELEKEREMLQLADSWREERVQMKLSEAKYHFEEKNAAVDQLRNELEAFLATKRLKENKPGIENHGNEQVREEEQLVHPGRSYVVTGVFSDGTNKDGEVVHGDEDKEQDDEVNSADSDLHSIELNMDGNSKSCRWSYATGDAQDKKLANVEEKLKGMSSCSDKMSSGSFSIGRDVPEGTEWGFDKRKFQHVGEVVDQGRLSESTSLLTKQTRKFDPDAERYKSVKGLRDSLLFGSRFASAGGLASPTRQWMPLQPSVEHGRRVCEGFNVVEMAGVIREGRLKAKTLGAKR